MSEDPSRGEVLKAIGGLEAKMDIVLDNQKDLIVRDVRLSARVAKLEQHRSYLAGALAVLALFGTWIAKQISFINVG